MFRKLATSFALYVFVFRLNYFLSWETRTEGGEGASRLRSLSPHHNNKTIENFRSLGGQKPNHSGSKTEWELREWGVAENKTNIFVSVAENRR